MLISIEANYRREGTGYGSRFEGERLEVVQARAVIRRVQALAADLADVLARMVVGWEPDLGVDLAKHPEIVRVMARYRREVAAAAEPRKPMCGWPADGQRPIEVGSE